MRPRDFTPIESVPLVGGRLCLDFTNTTGNRSGAESRERLESYEDLIVFGRRAGVLDEAEEAAAIRFAEEESAGASDVLAGMIALREVIYRLFLSSVEDRSPAPSDLELLNEQQTRAFSRRKLVWGSPGPQWVFEVEPGELDSLRMRVIASAVDLLTSPDLDHVKKCGDCDWLFVDTSRNKRRRWCKKACGDRVRARRHYDQRRRGPKA